MGVALVLMIVLLLLTKPIVTVMSTPQEAVMGTISYLFIICMPCEPMDTAVVLATPSNCPMINKSAIPYNVCKK